MAIQDLMEVLGYKKEAESIKELVSMPMYWSSLHGVAILVTPIFKMVYNTDPLPHKVILKLLSDHYPEHGARGNQFPFTDVKPIQFHTPTFNGFKTMAAMRDAHQFILSALPEALDGRILDLGCGTGELLRLLKDEYQVVSICGIDNQADLITRAIKNSKDGSFIETDIFDYQWDTEFELTLIAMQRFTEVERSKVEKLLDNIVEKSDYLLLYSYGVGWFNGVDDLINTRFQVVSATRDSSKGYEAILLERKTP